MRLLAGLRGSALSASAESGPREPEAGADQAATGAEIPAEVGQAADKGQGLGKLGDRIRQASTAVVGQRSVRGGLRRAGAGPGGGGLLVHSNTGVAGAPREGLPAQDEAGGAVAGAGGQRRRARGGGAPGGRGSWLASAAAALTLALVPFWWHLSLVDPGSDNITAVFSMVGIFASDLGLIGLAMLALVGPQRLDRVAATVGLGWALLAAATLVSAAAAIDPAVAAGVAAQMALLGLAWLGLWFHRPLKVPWLAAAAVGSGAVQALLAVAQFMLQQPLVPDWLGLPWLPGADLSLGGTPVLLTSAGERLLRAFGTFPHPNVLGGYLALGMVLVPALPGDRRWRWLAAAVLGAGLLASFSRAAWLAALLGLAVWARRQGAGRRLPSPAALVTAAIALGLVLVSPLAPLVASRLLPSNALERGSVENRLALDRSALSEARDHLPLGVGAENYGVVALVEGRQEIFGEPAPNLLLLIGAELGVPGGLAGVVLAGGVLLLLKRGGRAARPALAALVAVLVLGMLDHYLWTMPPGRSMAWLPVALLAAIRRAEERSVEGGA